MDIAIRSATLEDAEPIHRLHTLSVRGLCAQSYESKVIEGWLLGRSAAGYTRAISKGITSVALVEERIVGFCESIPGEILAVFVDPALKGRGVGTALMRQALDRAGRDGANIRLEATLNAVGFYERFGFRRAGNRTVRRNDVDVPVVLMERGAG